jgi:lysylphosphatidylglycerol synthetase-like protein (DUF2156 family)
VTTPLELARLAAATARRRLPLTAALVAVVVLVRVAPVDVADHPVADTALLLGALALGVAEWRLGSRRAVLAAVLAHLAGVGGGMLLVAAAAGHGWVWTGRVPDHSDLGLTSAFLGAGAAASVTLSPRWRGRFRTLLLGYAVIALLVFGDLADLERLLSVAAGLAVGPLVGSVVRPGGASFRPDRRPARSGLSALEAEAQRAAVKDLLRGLGSTNRLAWMTTWPTHRWYHGVGVQGYLAHQVHAGVAIGLCDPVASDGTNRATVLREFADRSRRAGLTPCVMAATAETAAAAVAMGWRVIPVGEEAVVDLPGLSFQGRAWQDVRTALNHGARHGVTVLTGPLGSLSESLRQQVAESSGRWADGRRLPELGFTLGGLDEAADPEVRVAVAVDREGVVQGVVSWLPSYRPSDGTVVGWTLDVMRRRGGDSGFRPVMELLIASSLVRFRDEGCSWASLSASPLSHLVGQRCAARPSSGVDALLQHLAGRLEPFYGFRSLRAFKAKFSPRFDALYLVYPSDVALPRISIALARAYLPGARVRDLAALRAERPTPERRTTAPVQASTPGTTRALTAAAASSGSSTDT